MILIMYVCVASRWLSVRGIHSTDTIFFLSHGVEGGGGLGGWGDLVVSTQCAEGLSLGIWEN